MTDTTDETSLAPGDEDDGEEIVLDRGIVPVGEHTAIAEDVTANYSSKGTRMLNWYLRIVEGPAADQTLYYGTPSEGPGRFRLDQILNALGQPQTGKVSARKLLGLPMTVVVEHEEWEGEVRARVKKVKKYEDIPEQAPF